MDNADPTSSNADKIKTMLTSREVDLVAQGIELLMVLADEDLANEFLEGVDFTTPERMMRGVRIHRLILAGLSGLFGHPSSQGIRTLEIRSLRGMTAVPPDLVGGIANWPDLETLEFSAGGRMVMNLGALRSAPSLRELRFRGPVPVSSDHITGIETLDQLEIFYSETTSAPRACFPPGARRPSTEKPHTIVVAPATIDLGNIADVPDIKGVVIRDHRLPISVAPLAKIKDLRFLDIRGSAGVTDVSAFSGHPELRVIAGYQSGIDIAQVPEDLVSLISLAKNPKLTFDRKRFKARTTTSATKPASTKPKPPKITDGAAWPAIEADMASKFDHAVLRAADQVVKLGPDAIELVLSRIVVGEKGYLISRPPVRVNHRLALPALAGRLLLSAPAESAQANRLRSILRLTIDGTSRNGNRPHIRHLEAFLQLRELHLHKLGSPTLNLGDMPRLDSLSMLVNQQTQLVVPPSLRRLTLHREPLLDLESLRDSNIEELTVFMGDAVPLAEAFRTKPLKRASLLDEAAVAILAECPLEQLETDARFLGPLVGHPTLKQVVVQPGTASAVPGALQHLVIEKHRHASDHWMPEMTE